jgi:hypothetical protein
MDGSALDPFCIRAEMLFKARRDFARGFVRKSESANARWIESSFLDEKADSFYEAISLSGPGPRQHEQRLRIRFNRSAL